MRYAVRDRPVEEFDTDLKLPDWQLEPDEELYYGEEGEYYYYIDEQGNLVEPGRTQRAPEDGFDVEGEGEGIVRDPLDPRGMDQEPGQQGTGGSGRPKPPQAASDDFLEQATGQDLPNDEPRQRRLGDELINEQRF